MTKKEMFNEIIVLAQGNILTHATLQEIIDFANHEIELLERKSSKTTMTKTQKENELLMAQIVEAFSEIENPVTITEFMKISEHEVAKLSNQKLSALLKKLTEGENAPMVKTVEKKKSYFSIKREEE